MRANLFVGDSGALVAVEELPEKDCLDSEVRKFLEYFVGSVRTVIVSDAGVVSADSASSSASVNLIGMRCEPLSRLSDVIR